MICFYDCDLRRHLNDYLCMLGDIPWENIVYDGCFVLISDIPCYIIFTLMYSLIL